MAEEAAPAVDPSSPCQVRSIEAGDLPLLSAWLADEAMQAVMEDEPGGEVAVRRKLRGLVDRDPVRDRECAYLVSFQGRAIGYFHVLKINWISRTCEIDVMVEPSTQRSLLGLWVVSKIAEVCFDQLNLRKVYGFIFASNKASARFFSKLGPIEATLKAGRRPPRGDEDVHIAALTAESYREMRKRYKWDEFIKGRGRGA